MSSLAKEMGDYRFLSTVDKLGYGVKQRQLGLPFRQPRTHLDEILAGFYWNPESMAMLNNAGECCRCFKVLRVFGALNLGQEEKTGVLGESLR